MGRPSSYTDVVAEEICRRIADGESLRKICDGTDMPNRATVLRWMADDDAFAAKCAHARTLQADAIFEDMQAVADEGNPEDVQRARLRVSTMQWRAAKLAPKKYGEKLELAHSGAIETMTDERLDARLAQLLGKAGTGVDPGGEGEAEG